MSKEREILFWMAGWPLVFLFLLPIIALLFQGFHADFLSALFEEETRKAVWISLKTCTLTTLFIAVSGFPLALWLAQRKPGARALDIIVPIEQLPAKYRTEKREWIVNSDILRTDLESGVEVDGVALFERGDSLRIKCKDLPL